MSSSMESRRGSASIADQAKEAVEHIAEAASEYTSAWGEQCKQLTESTEEYVRKQPIKSLLIAAGIGLLLGLAARR